MTLTGGGGINHQYEKIKIFSFPIHKTDYTLTINQFSYLEEFHTKYKDKNLTSKKYHHFHTLRDMNWLTINKTWLRAENNQSIRVIGKEKPLFDYLDQLKIWFSKNKTKYWFLGNLSPIIFPALIKKLKTNDKLKEEQFTAQFEKLLLRKKNSFLATENQLIWQLTNISAGHKYRFKHYPQLYNQGEVWPSATKPLSKNTFLEIQIAYDKTVKDFYLKPSLHKINFINNKGEKKYFFELSDILAWGFYQQWVSYQELTKIHHAIKKKKFLILEKKETIKRKMPEISHFFSYFNFQKVTILKPSYIACLFDQDFLEIKLDYRQKASGVQAMLFYNISIDNLTKNEKKLTNQLVTTKDLLIFVIDKTKFRKTFLPLISLFAQLSDKHCQDMENIVAVLLASWEEKKGKKLKQKEE